jgi:hypothetical protein
MLGGAKYLGQMRLPAGSQNHIFHRPDGELVMVAWNPEPTREVLYLGQNVKTFDLEGRPVAATKHRGDGVDKNDAVLELGPKPVFVLGLHEAIARWRMAMAFEHVQIPSINTVPHANSLKLKNFFPQGVGGSLKIVVPQDHTLDASSPDENPAKESADFVSGRWNIEPPHGTFALAAGEETTFPFEVRLKNAFFGKQPIRVDFFNVQADETYNFSVYTELEVGTGDLSLEVHTHLNEDGALIVEQLMTNRAKHLADFRCKLYPKSRRPLRMQVYRLGPNVDRKIYRIPDGKELVGRQMLLDIEELNGKRVLKYRFVATAESAAGTADASDANAVSPPGTDASPRQPPKTNLNG